MNDTPHNFLVIFQPEGQETVATMRVVDAWASSSPSLVQARKTMSANEAKGDYTKYGRGQYQVVKQDTCRQFETFRPEPTDFTLRTTNEPVEEAHGYSFFPPLRDDCQYSTMFKDDKAVATLNRRRAYDRGPVWTLYLTDGSKLAATYLTRYAAVAKFAANILNRNK